jgi:two-component system chemotaxis response regulator CheB
MRNSQGSRFDAIVIGVSTGGVSALKYILGALPTDFAVPVLIVTHLSPDTGDGLAVLLDSMSAIHIKEADEQEIIIPGNVYLAPANYHLLLGRGGLLTLSVDPPVNFARPSIDVLFESAADVYGPTLIGVILTGAGNDGSRGLLKIHNCGGVTIVQNPADAEMESMPRSALDLQKADYVVQLNSIPSILKKLVQEQQ